MNQSKTILISTVATSLLVLAGCTTKTAINTNTANDNANVEVVTNTNATVSNENTNAEQGSEVDTTNWLTYTNDEYGFSFRYPKEWEIKDYSKTSVFINVPNQVLRLQFNSDQTEYHMVLYKDNVQNIIDEIKNDDPSASFVKAENDISINSNSYKYVSVLAAIGSLVDYYIQSYGTEYTIVWVANPYTDQAIIRAWISTFR